MRAKVASRRLSYLYSGIGALALTALAFFLRVYRLGDKNVWWDEGWTVWLAKHDFAWIALRTASDEHPPLHYWLMNLWQTIFGAEAFTGRFFSLVFGVLLVALVYRIGKEIGGARLGFLAALFLSLARFNVWWSQDIKNYTLSAFFAWASVLFVWRLTFSRSKMPGHFAPNLNWLGYIFATTLALYSHYLAALIVLANNLFVGIVVVAKWRRGENFIPLLVRWSLAQLAVVLLFAPWLYVYLQHGATWSAAPAFDFGLFLQLAATVLMLGVTTYIENYTWIVLTIVLVGALSLGWFIPQLPTGDEKPPQHSSSSMFAQEPGARNEGASVAAQSSSLMPHALFAWGTLYMLLVALLPPALIYLLSLTPAAIFAPKIQARYLMMLTPAVAMLLALGTSFVATRFRGRIPELAAPALVLLIAAAQIFTLNDYFGERILRDDYFSLVQMINNFGAESDAIVLNTDQEYPTFLYYLTPRFISPGEMDWIGVPNGAKVDAATARRIAAEVYEHDAVWVVTIPDALQQDPAHLVEGALAERLPKQYEQTFGDKRLALYASSIRNVKDATPKNFSPQMRRDDTFDERLKLVGVDLPVHEAFPGDIVRVVTYWQAQDLTTINLALQTAAGEIVARASIPISIGAHERAQGDLQIPPDAIARGNGELRVVAQARLSSRALGTIGILPREGLDGNAGDGAMQARSERFGESIRLYGVSAPLKQLRAGESVPVTLFWQTSIPLTTSYTVFVHLLGSQYNPAQNNFLWGQIDRLPLAGKLPTTAWTPGQTIADAYEFKLDAAAPNGTYKIEVGLYDAATGARLRVFDSNGNDVGDSLIAGTVQVQ